MKLSSYVMPAALALGGCAPADAFGALRPAPAAGGVGPLASTVEGSRVEISTAAVSRAADDAAVSGSGMNDTGRIRLSPEFQSARDEATAALTASLPDPALAGPLVHFLDEYLASLNTASIAGTRNPDGSDITARQGATTFMNTVRYGVKYGLGAGPGGKFVFEDVRWKALRGRQDDERYERLSEVLGPDRDMDFYAAGCDFFRPSMDLEKSVVLGEENLEKAMAQIAAGENVVFLANHQSEADPQVVSCLFEQLSQEAADLAAHVTYVAGHKVTTDPLAVPFSMGRNLLCIHSKKHIDADPETKPAKSRQNMSAMNSMLAGLKDGGMAIWVAPSGGRDRRDIDSGRIPIASFDRKTVDMFRLMGNKSRKLTHFYPMSMVSYGLCPPPDFVEAGVGEKRNVRFTPVGISVCDEVPNVGGAEKRGLFSELAEKECREGYKELLRRLDMDRYMPEEDT